MATSTSSSSGTSWGIPALYRECGIEGELLNDLKTELLASRQAGINPSSKPMPINSLTASIAALKIAVLDNNTAAGDFICGLLEKQKLQKIEQASSKMQLSALHVAVICHRPALVERLLQAKATPNAQDARGWTPLHHAALANHVELMERLLKAGADQRLETDTGGTYAHILDLTKQKMTDPRAAIPLIKLDAEGNETPLTSEAFQKITGAEYSEELLVERECLVQEWTKRPSFDGIFSFAAAYREPYLKFRASPPVHLIAKIERDSSGNALSQSPGWGICSTKSFEKGEIIGEYTGIKTKEKTASSAYSSLGNVEAERFGSSATRINDGTPNVMILFLPDCMGLAQRTIYLASERILKGDQFCSNYGNSIKKHSYSELRGKEVRQFIKTHTIRELLPDFIELGRSHKRISFDGAIKANMLAYIFQTPSIVFNMLLDGSISFKLAQEIIDVAHMAHMLPGSPPRQAAIRSQMCSQVNAIMQLEKKLAVLSLPLATQYAAFFKALPSRTGIYEVLNAAEQTHALMTNMLMQNKPLFGDFSNPDALNKPLELGWKTIREKVEKVFIV